MTKLELAIKNKESFESIEDLLKKGETLSHEAFDTLYLSSDYPSGMDSYRAEALSLVIRHHLSKPNLSKDDTDFWFDHLAALIFFSVYSQDLDALKISLTTLKELNLTPEQNDYILHSYKENIGDDETDMMEVPALGSALNNGDIEAMKLLMAAGANPHYKIKKDMTLIDHALSVHISFFHILCEGITGELKYEILLKSIQNNPKIFTEAHEGFWAVALHNLTREQKINLLFFKGETEQCQKRNLSEGQIMNFINKKTEFVEFLSLSTTPKSFTYELRKVEVDYEMQYLASAFSTELRESIGSEAVNPPVTPAFNNKARTTIIRLEQQAKQITSRGALLPPECPRRRSSP